MNTDDLVDDGFGTSAPAVCPICGLRAMYVCRPGDIRCGVCYDNNPREWYTPIPESLEQLLLTDEEVIRAIYDTSASASDWEGFKKAGLKPYEKEIAKAQLQKVQPELDELKRIIRNAENCIASMQKQIDALKQENEGLKEQLQEADNFITERQRD